MILKRIILPLIFVSMVLDETYAQSAKLQQGLLYKKGTNIRLGSIQVLNKRSLAKSRSSVLGVFDILAQRGDTLCFCGDNFQSNDVVVTDFADQVIFLEPVIQLNEVIVAEHSLKNDIKEAQMGYRKKAVFYTGTPHYYYLVLKPMTFIYENFKSEVIDARRFNRYAKRELAYYKVAERFNDTAIKKIIPIKKEELADFELDYFPTVAQINAWSDYDLINYIKNSYVDFRKPKQAIKIKKQ